MEGTWEVDRPSNISPIFISGLLWASPRVSSALLRLTWTLTSALTIFSFNLLLIYGSRVWGPRSYLFYLYICTITMITIILNNNNSFSLCSSHALYNNLVHDILVPASLFPILKYILRTVNFSLFRTYLYG